MRKALLKPDRPSRVLHAAAVQLRVVYKESLLIANEIIAARMSIFVHAPSSCSTGSIGDSTCRSAVA